jgi:hypothetical protein
MGHLSPEDFVDLVEDVRAEASLPHLAQCARCRDQLADTREAIAASAEADLPEPSPLFWDHLSARVREAVEREARADAPFARASAVRTWWLRATAGVAACLVAVGVVASLRPRDVVSVTTPAGQPGGHASPGSAPLAALPASPDDPSFDLVADFGGTLDWDDLREQMTDAPHAGGLDATVGALDLGERQELLRLLKEELARPTARADRS